MNLIRTVFLLLFATGCAAAQIADPQWGLVPSQTFSGSDFDHINVKNGLLNFSIPLWDYAQRGGKIKLGARLQYNSGYYGLTTIYDPSGGIIDTMVAHSTITTVPYSQYTGAVMRSIQSAGFNFVSDGVGGVKLVAQYKVAKDGETIFKTGEPSNGTQAFTETTLVTPDGSAHPFNTLADGSGISMSLDGTGYRTGATGILDSSGVGSETEDADGNTIGSSVDTLGRTLPAFSTASDTTGCTGALPISSASIATVPAANSTMETYKFCYVQLPIYIADATSSTGNDLSTTLQVLQSIVLPNGQNWTFEYNASQPGDPAGTNYGEVTKITLPSGGSLSYTYAWRNYPVVTSRTMYDGVSSKTWTYILSNNAGGDFNAGEASVTDPDGNVTLTEYNSEGYEGRSKVYSGSSTLLKQTDTTYLPGVHAITPSETVNIYSTIDVLPQTVTTTLPNGLVTKKVFTYCCDYSFSGFGIGFDGTNEVGAAQTVTADYGIKTGEDEYDWGVGTPGSLLKSTHTDFLWQSNPAYLSSNLLDTPSVTTVKDGSGNIVSQTNYYYDDPSSIGIASGMSNAQQLNAPPVAGVLGHPTTVTQWLNGGTGPTTHITYYDTGEVASKTDALGYTTSLAYSMDYWGGLPTSITDALNETTTYTYDLNTGQKASATDLNGKTTHWSFDTIGRLTTMATPDGGSTTYCYKDNASDCSSYSSSAPLYSFSIQKALAGSGSTSTEPAYMNSEIDFDGLGRKIQTKTFETASSTIYTDTHYDDLGRVASVSNPYRSTSDPTYGLTTYTYDALGKKLTETHPDGGVLRWCYDGVAAVAGQTGCYSNASSKSSASWVDSTDESGNHLQHLSDGLARLVAVMEPSPSTGTLALETDYTYDTLGNLTYVNQIGNGTETPRTRSFTYDSLSRLLTSNNPESGQISYSYDADSNLVSKTDARNVTISYGYDVLNRLTSKTYSGIDTASNAIAARTPPVGYVYGSSSSSVTNGKGRLVSEYTGSSSAPITTHNVLQYDAVGRILTDNQCAVQSLCASSPYSFTYMYDLAGNVSYSNNGVSNTGIGFTYAYDGAGRLQTVSSTWDDPSTNHPATLFAPPASTLGVTQYSPAGLTAASLGIESSTNQPTFSLTRAYDNRMRVVSETDATTAGVSGAQSQGSITLAGIEPSATPAPATPGTGSVLFTGGDDTVYTCVVIAHVPRCSYVPDSGTFTITLSSPTTGATFTASFDYSGTGTGVAASGPSPADFAADLADTLNSPDDNDNPPLVSASVSDCPNTYVGAVTCASLNLVALSSGLGTDYTMQISTTDADDYPYIASGQALTGGSDGGQLIYDAGTLTVDMNNTLVTETWGDGSTASGIATQFATDLTATGLVSATASGSGITVQSSAAGAASNWSLSCGAADTTGLTAAFSISCAGMTGGVDAVPGGSPIYSYYITSYAPNGNLLSVMDSVMGSWAYGYDHLNRLSSGQAHANSSTGYAPYGTGLLNWTYDSFGNFMGQALTGSSPASVTQGSYSYPTADNRIYGESYDADGNKLMNQSSILTYDAEDRVDTANGTTAYVYDAEGNRVAKGSISGTTITPTNVYLLSAGGVQVSELDGSGAWLYTNAYAAGKQIATYDPNGLHFHFDDWLGTRRLQASSTGAVEESCQSLPFGDSVNCFNPSGGNILPGALGADTSEQHFTGKDHDNESGLDYFGARYFGSSMGRWMSPDWSAKAEPVPYAKLDNPQSLNLYAYVSNNPLKAKDADGHEVNATNPCNGAKNCTSKTTELSTTVKYDPKTDRTTVTTVSNVVATANNADGSSTRISANVTDSVTLNGSGKTISATESQSSTLVEQFNGANGTGGSKIGFLSAVSTHSVSIGRATEMVGGWNMESAGLEKGYYKIAEMHGYDRYTGESLNKNSERLEDANTLLEGLKEVVSDK